MKDKNGIEIKCENCAALGLNGYEFCETNADFTPSEAAYQARIAELEAEVEQWQSNAFEAQKWPWKRKTNPKSAWN